MEARLARGARRRARSTSLRGRHRAPGDEVAEVELLAGAHAATEQLEAALAGAFEDAQRFGFHLLPRAQADLAREVDGSEAFAVHAEVLAFVVAARGDHALGLDQQRVEALQRADHERVL